MLTHALYDKRVSRSIVYLASVLWLDTESLGFNAEVRGLGQFEIRLYLCLRANHFLNYLPFYVLKHLAEQWSLSENTIFLSLF